MQAKITYLKDFEIRFIDYLVFLIYDMINGYKLPAENRDTFKKIDSIIFRLINIVCVICYAVEFWRK